jgi:hypothetical protein
VDKILAPLAVVSPFVPPLIMTDRTNEPRSPDALDWKARSKARVRRAASRLTSSFPTIPALLGILLSVGFGFGLKAWWDESQASRLQHNEIQRSVRAVSLELKHNLDVASSNLQLMNDDIVFADKNMEAPLPASDFSIVVGQSVILRGVFDTISVESSEKLSTVYSSLEGLDQRVQQREFYRSTNRPMTNYNEVRKILDDDLRRRLIDIQSAIALLQEDLDRLRDPAPAAIDSGK